MYDFHHLTVMANELLDEQVIFLFTCEVIFIFTCDGPQENIQEIILFHSFILFFVF